MKVYSLYFGLEKEVFCSWKDKFKSYVKALGRWGDGEVFPGVAGVEIVRLPSVHNAKDLLNGRVVPFIILPGNSTRGKARERFAFPFHEEIYGCPSFLL